MSLFPQNQAISEIRDRTREELLVQVVNDCRLRPQQIYDWISDKLGQITREAKQMNFNSLGKIQIENQEDISQARDYFASLSKMQEVIGDLYFNQQYNQDFAKVQGLEAEEHFKAKLSINSMHYYTAPVVDPSLFNDLVCYLVLEEYFMMKGRRRCPSQTQSSLYTDQIALLSNHFNLCFVRITQTSICISLSYTCNFLSISHIGNHCVLPSSCREEQSEFRYQFIPMTTVYDLFTKMDLNRDGRIGVQDLQRQFQKLSIDVGEEVLRGMFEEAVAKRAVIFQEQRMKDLTLKEVYMAVQVRKKKEGKHWVIKPKWSTKYWMMLLKGVIGYDSEAKKKQNCGLGKSGSIRVKFIPTKQYNKKVRQDGDVTFKNTLTVREIDNRPKPKVHTESKIEQSINNRISKVSNRCSYNTITFETRRIYDLSLRSSIARFR